MTTVAAISPASAAPALAVPPPATPSPTWRIEPLWEADAWPAGVPMRGGTLPLELRGCYADRLEIPLRTDRPTIAANFVSTLDGIVALDRSGLTGGREISGGSEPDRFVMGLLRATADAVLVGAGTVRASRSKAWTPGQAHPSSARSYAAWRSSIGLASALPTTVIVSASGGLDLDRLDRSDPRLSVIVVTTVAGAHRLRARYRRERLDVVPVADAPRVPAGAVLDVLRERGFGLVLSEGGPTLFGQLLEARAVDELFLTVAPQVVGRTDGVGRLGLVEGVGFDLGLAPWAGLRSVLRSDDHLFLRYRIGDPGSAALS